MFVLFVERCSGESAEFRRHETKLSVEEAAKKAKDMKTAGSKLAVMTGIGITIKD